MSYKLNRQSESIYEKIQNQDSEDNSQVDTNIQTLNKTLNNLKEFIHNLTEDKIQPYQHEILSYSQKSTCIAKKSEEIIMLSEKRIEKMLRNKKAKKNWNQDDISVLVWILNKYTAYYTKKSVHSLEESDWKFISFLIPAVTWKKCMFRWLSLKKFSLLEYRWSTEQSTLLADLIKQYGKKNWKKLSELLYVENSSNDKIFRTPKQCREHWNCYLNPVIKKGPWSNKEDVKLLESVLELNCMKKWSEIAKNIKGRTENAVKNRFTLLIDKQKKVTGDQNEKLLINKALARLVNQEAHIKAQVKSEKIEQARTFNNFADESEEQKNKQICQKNASQMQRQAKNQGRLIIPKVLQSQVMLPETHQYFPYGFELNPFYFGFMYAGRYLMN